MLYCDYEIDLKMIETIYGGVLHPCRELRVLLICLNVIFAKHYGYELIVSPKWCVVSYKSL